MTIENNLFDTFQDYAFELQSPQPSDDLNCRLIKCLTANYQTILTSDHAWVKKFKWTLKFM